MRAGERKPTAAELARHTYRTGDLQHVDPQQPFTPKRPVILERMDTKRGVARPAEAGAKKPFDLYYGPAK